MKIHDLSHEIHNHMTVFSEQERPLIEYKYTIDKDGFAMHVILLNSHSGTHIDAPAHVLKGANYLDNFSLEKFTGKGMVLDVSAYAESEIPLSFFVTYKEDIAQTDFLLLNTGWHHKWGTEDYRANYPTLSVEAAQWLVQFKLKGIGLDSISIDRIESTCLPIHHIVLGADMLIIENLTNLNALPVKGFEIQCFPLKISKADGSTSRVVAFE